LDGGVSAEAGDLVERGEGLGAGGIDFGVAGAEEIGACGGEGGLEVRLFAPATECAGSDVEPVGDVLRLVSLEEEEECGAVEGFESVVGLLV